MKCIYCDQELENTNWPLCDNCYSPITHISVSRELLEKIVDDLFMLAPIYNNEEDEEYRKMARGVLERGTLLKKLLSR